MTLSRSRSQISGSEIGVSGIDPPLRTVPEQRKRGLLREKNLILPAGAIGLAAACPDACEFTALEN
jgi:hypothetical protein